MEYDRLKRKEKEGTVRRKDMQSEYEREMERRKIEE
jgi:hypothetical protein